MKLLSSLLGLLLLFFVTMAYAAPVIEISGKVVGVHDGDTLTLLNSQKNAIKVRLAEIDAPELRQPYGQKSKQYLSSLVFNKAVYIKVVNVDRYGRTVGRVYFQGRDINREMIASGMAWVYRQYLKDKSLLDIEEVAKSKMVGVWSLSDKDNVPPWEWRKNSKPRNR